MKKSIYLACPYTTEDWIIKETRVLKATILATKLMDTYKYIVFSPLTHTHLMDKYLSKENNNWKFWSEQDYWFLERCDILLVYMLDGWKESVGVTDEIEFAKKYGKEIVYIREEDVDKLIKGV